jgi:hypothetical protein
MTSDTEEVPLSGGMITSGVVRVGGTVRRPTGEHSSFVHDLLLHFEASGVDGVPRYLGLDEHGREILTFVAGDTTTEFKERDWSLEQITAAARLLRRLHDATAGTAIAGGAEVVCHNDFTPMNVVFADGLPVGVFDFDQARPGERLRCADRDADRRRAQDARRRRATHPAGELAASGDRLAAGTR